MFKESVQLISTRCAACSCGFTDDIIGILSTELVRHHPPECIEGVPLFGLICVGCREIGTDQHSDLGIKGCVVIAFRFLKDVRYVFSEPPVFTVCWKFFQRVNSSNKVVKCDKTVGFSTPETCFELDNWIAIFAAKSSESVHQQLAKSRGDVCLVKKDVGFFVFWGSRFPVKNFLKIGCEFGFSERTFNHIRVRTYHFAPWGEVGCFSTREFRFGCYGWCGVG